MDTSPPATDPAPELEAQEEVPAGFLILDRLNKFFGSHQVIKDLSLTVEAGEILALLGPSGSGKTTVLRMLAGFETPDLGRILVDGEEVTRRPPSRRGFGMVFQNYALFPHLSVGKNVSFGLEAARQSAEQITERVRAMLDLADLEGFENRRVGEISGGQQQRVALARALAPAPRLLMLDEPLSNLDPALRERTREELRRAIKGIGITTLLVTHEQDEAFELGDRVGVLHDGRLEQVATPRELYEQPATRFVATFIGRAAVLQGVVEATSGGRARVRLLGRGSEIGVADWWATAAEPIEPGEAVDLVVRPESLEMAVTAEEPAGTESVEGEVRGRRYTGALTFFRVQLDLGDEVEVTAAADAVSVGQRVRLTPRSGGSTPRIFPRQRRELE